jgi:predicted pyridoxine 5'-phosphate oxidase superfamily flavin-nucleotide-binding protein
MGQYEEEIRTRSRLRELISEPPGIVTAKVIDHIDDHCRRFIAASPLVMV